jgi:hypothetical protein
MPVALLKQLIKVINFAVAIIKNNRRLFRTLNSSDVQAYSRFFHLFPNNGHKYPLFLGKDTGRF